jgi:hypothetical protein
MNRTLAVLMSVVVVASAAWLGRDALAQVPTHRPGTVCFTPTFWCWANPPGPPGAVCYCPSPRGPVPGKLG